MAWYDFFLEQGSQSQDFTDLIRIINFGLIFLATLVFLIIVSFKSRKHESEINANKTVRFVYFGVMVAVSILSIENIVGYFTNYGVRGNPSMLITIVGYTITLYAFNLFLLLTVNFRQRTNKVITLLASFEVALMVVIDLIMVISVFYDLPSVVEDFSVIILGVVVIIVVIFTLINIALEIKNTANKMAKIKLSTALIGIIGFFLDGLANVVNLVLETTGFLPEFRVIFVDYIIPIMAVIFYAMVLFGFYYSLYPPEWLQIRTGVLPPTFSRMMKNQAKTGDRV